MINKIYFVSNFKLFLHISTSTNASTISIQKKVKSLQLLTLFYFSLLQYKVNNCMNFRIKQQQQALEILKDISTEAHTWVFQKNTEKLDTLYISLHLKNKKYIARPIRPPTQFQNRHKRYIGKSDTEIKSKNQTLQFNPESNAKLNYTTPQNRRQNISVHSYLRTHKSAMNDHMRLVSTPFFSEKNKSFQQYIQILPKNFPKKNAIKSFFSHSSQKQFSNNVPDKDKRKMYTKLRKVLEQDFTISGASMLQNKRIQTPGNICRIKMKKVLVGRPKLAYSEKKLII